MSFRTRLLATTTLLGLAGLLSGQAHAGLLGTTGQTVQAFYYNGVFASPEGELTSPTGNDDPKLLTSPVAYIVGAADGSTIAVADTQIIITNLLSGAPFCNATPAQIGTACANAIDGFDFKFTDENIPGVSTDPASAADFRPVTGSFQGNAHLGLQLLSNDEVRVDVTGDEPAVGDQLIVDLRFAVPPPPPPPPTNAPEPGTLALLGSALVGLNVVRRRRKQS